MFISEFLESFFNAHRRSVVMGGGALAFNKKPRRLIEAGRAKLMSSSGVCD